MERGSLEWSVARSVYLAGRPRVRIDDQPLVVVDLAGSDRLVRHGAGVQEPTGRS